MMTHDFYEVELKKILSSLVALLKYTFVSIYYI